MASAFTVIAVCLVVGSCWFRAPGGPGLSPLAAGLAVAAIACVVGRLGLGKAGCVGVLLVLAAAAQVMLGASGRRRGSRSPDGSRTTVLRPSQRVVTRWGGSPSTWTVAPLLTPPAGPDGAVGT